jgi:hypothetical protein
MLFMRKISNGRSEWSYKTYKISAMRKVIHKKKLNNKKNLINTI